VRSLAALALAALAGAFGHPHNGLLAYQTYPAADNDPTASFPASAEVAIAPTTGIKPARLTGTTSTTATPPGRRTARRSPSTATVPRRGNRPTSG